MDQTPIQAGGKCRCPHHGMIPIFIVLIGVDFLLGAFDILSSRTVDIIWPVLLILGGLMKVGEGKGMCKCCNQ